MHNDGVCILEYCPDCGVEDGLWMKLEGAERGRDHILIQRERESRVFIGENREKTDLRRGRGFPGGSDGKESACNVGDLGSRAW